MTTALTAAPTISPQCAEAALAARRRRSELRWALKRHELGLVHALADERYSGWPVGELLAFGYARSHFQGNTHWRLRGAWREAGEILRLIDLAPSVPVHGLSPMRRHQLLREVGKRRGWRL